MCKRGSRHEKWNSRSRGFNSLAFYAQVRLVTMNKYGEDTKYLPWRRATSKRCRTLPLLYSWYCGPWRDLMHCGTFLDWSVCSVFSWLVKVWKKMDFFDQMVKIHKLWIFFGEDLYFTAAMQEPAVSTFLQNLFYEVILKRENVDIVAGSFMALTICSCLLRLTVVKWDHAIFENSYHKSCRQPQTPRHFLCRRLRSSNEPP